MTEREIQNALYNFRRRRADKFFAPNFYFGQWETDFISITNRFKVWAFEIKISRGDFRADFQKFAKHNALKARKSSPGVPNRFYYVTPSQLVRKFEVPNYAGLLWINSNGRSDVRSWSITVEKTAPTLHREPADSKLIRKICVSLMWRYWRLRQKRK